DMTVAKYLYTQQMTKQGYETLGLPPEFHTKVEDTAEKLPDEALQASLDKDLTDAYFASVLKKGNDMFASADKVFEEGQKVSSTSTQFGLDGMFFTITLFLGGLALVIKSNMRWGFVISGYAALGYAAIKLMSLPWYHA